MNGYRGKVGECNLSFLYFFEPKKLRYTKRLNDSKSAILEDIRFNSFYKKQVLEITIEDSDNMIVINTEPERTEEPTIEKKSYSFYLLDKINDITQMEEHKDLVDFLQTYYPKEFSIPFPTNIEFDNQIVSNQGNSLSK